MGKTWQAVKKTWQLSGKILPEISLFLLSACHNPDIDWISQGRRLDYLEKDSHVLVKMSFLSFSCSLFMPVYLCHLKCYNHMKKNLPK